MSDVQEYAARLSQVIGPRPAGTEEEQQASFFIDEVLQEAGMEVRTEEFRCNLNYRMPRVICCLFTVILGFLSLFLNMLVLPAMIICLVTAALFALDCLELSPFANFGNKGLSQNIVAKYEPPVQNGAGPDGAMVPASGARASRRRKVILVANYDSGKVRRELKPPILGILHIIRWVELGAMVLVPLALLIRLISGENSGPLVMFTNVLTVIGVIGALLVLLAFITYQIAAYSDGANNNASGVAVMLEVAHRIGALRDVAPQEAVMHGAREAYAAGVVPEGAELVYAQDAEPDGFELAASGEFGAADVPALSGEATNDAAASGIDSATASPADTLGIAEMQAAKAAAAVNDVAAKAAEAANALAADPASNAGASEEAVAVAAVAEAGSEGEAAGTSVFVTDGQAGGQDVAAAAAVGASAVGGSAASIFEQPSSEPSVPDWYKRAMSKANKADSSSAPDPSKRSKFSDALDAAAAASRPEPEPVNPIGLSSDAEQRLQAMRESIMSGRPLSEATGTVGDGDAAEIAEAMENGEIEQAFEEIESIAAEPSAATPQGVDGYLSSTMSSPSYEAAQASDNEKQSRGKAARQTSKRIISADGKPAPATDAAQKEPRKKRSIMLPSLTGALKAVSVKDGAAGTEADATANDVANNDAEVAAIAARNSNKLKKANLAASLPSLGKSGEGTSGIDMGGATGSLEPITPEERAAAAHSSSAPAAHAQLSPSEEAQLLEEETSAQRRQKSQSRSQAQRRVADPSATISISQVGSFANAGMTGAFEPLGSEFVADMSAEDIYIDDADDSDYEENFTEHGALAGPGYVEMPKSRREKMFGKLRRKGKKQDDISFSEAMGIEEGYDARQVGKDRGGWESFRQGGRSSGSNDAWGDDEWNGGAYNPRNLRNARDVRDMREDIYEFHEGPVQLEVWFVALGAELANNAGMKSFIAEHTNDLRGAMIVDIDALGAGELTMIEREGAYRPASMSSRLKRYVHKAGDAIGIRVGTTSMLWDSSAAYVAERHGCQTLHLAGIKDGKPAYMAESDDITSNLDPELMEENAAFIMEFIRAI